MTQRDNLIDWEKTVPGDTVILDAWVRLESISCDKDFAVGRDMVYCLCVGRVASTTASGLTLLKVYLLTPNGVGYKRFNLGGNKRPDPNRSYRTWT